MSELEIGPELVGRSVCIAARPEWGEGKVLRVQSTTAGSESRHRVSIQFAIGHRVLQVPPARLCEPQPQPQRERGWLDAAAGNTLDGRLRGLPDAVSGFLGTPAQRLAMLAPLYTYTEDPSSLSKWARDQTQVADPLSLWSRDELLAAFRVFCDERDAELRIAAAKLKHAEGQAALEDALAGLPQALVSAMRAALQRPI